jgi:hypothetical protein
MKQVKHLALLFMITSTGWACPTCERAQPVIFRGITHGAGPDSNWDYVIISSTVLIVLYCSYLFLKKMMDPKERDKNHIKNVFLN